MTTYAISKRLPPFRPELRVGVRQGWKRCTRRTNGLDEINQNPDQWALEGQAPDGGWVFCQKDAPTEKGLWLENIRCPYPNGGDRVHLIEPMRLDYIGTRPIARYRDDDDAVLIDGSYLPWRWKKAYTTSLHMPTEAARWFGRITEIRVERVQEITEEDAVAEGCIPAPDGGGGKRNPCGVLPLRYPTARDAFQSLWDDINGEGAFDASPWVWVLRWEGEQ